ncbi:dihydroorotate dehydrogenase [Spirochaetia bacterium]|nr:dihydroorotate dehydrogenase [Spirochaetia bacterium]
MNKKNTDKVKPDTSVNIAGVHFKNPVIAASGTFGYGTEYSGLLDAGSLGGICTKGLTLNARAGNRGTRLWETPSGLLNSIGLENPGITVFIKEKLPALQKLGTVIIANLSGGSIEEYAEGAQLLDNSGIDMIELNISCPNVKSGGMAFGLDPSAAASVVHAVRKSSAKPLVVKLSPNAPGIKTIAKTCAQEGADALSLVNTFAGMAIDIKKRKPVFENIIAGLSGAAIRPLALRAVWDVCGEINIPVIGLGGITSANDALEFLMAGASAVEVGTAAFVNPAAMIEIIGGIENYMIENKINKLAELKLR